MRVVVALGVLASCGRVGFDISHRAPDARATDADRDDDGGVATRQLVIGWSHSCVLEPDGQLRCWGSNANSQLGLGPSSDLFAPADSVTGQVAAGAGQLHTCSLDTGGNIRCWGNDFNGQLGRSPLPCANGGIDNGEQCDDLNWTNGDGCTSMCQSGTEPPDAIAPTPIEGTRRYRGLYVRRFTTCAIATDGTLWCWGRNSARQLGIGDNADRGRPFQVVIVAPQTGPDNQWAQVAIGSDHTCARQLDNSLWCWGADGFGQLGQGGTPYVRERPNRVGSAAWSDIASGIDFSCGVQTDGSVWCWGANEVSQLGLGDMVNRFEPRLVDPGPFVRIGAGGSMACAIAASGQMKCWGENVDGQIGIGSPDASVMQPTVVAGDWVEVSGGSSYACGLRRDGDVYCWGMGDNGRLGDGTDNDSRTPVRVML